MEPLGPETRRGAVFKKSGFSYTVAGLPD